MKNQLVDSFGREHTYLRISVTDRCNLRCQYCMPQEGLKWKKRSEILSYEEIEKLAAIFVSMGIKKIRLTGGEPLVRHDLITLVEKLAAIQGLETLAMTTNATLLAPQAKRLKELGLSAINISLDSFRRERLTEIARVDCYETVMAGVEAAIAAGFKSLKLNMVVIAGFNDDEVLDFARFAARHDINVRFIEFMPFKDNQWQPGKVVTYQQIKAKLEEEFKLVARESEPGAVAKDFAIEGGRGSLSFITSMSESFCATCNRLRITADGSVKSCLFYPAEINLRDSLRQNISISDLQGMILSCLAQKPEAHPPAEQIAAQENRAMIEIGG